jgi:hypothetical protein
MWNLFHLTLWIENNFTGISTEQHFKSFFKFTHWIFVCDYGFDIDEFPNMKKKKENEISITFGLLTHTKRSDEMKWNEMMLTLREVLQIFPKWKTSFFRELFSLKNTKASIISEFFGFFLLSLFSLLISIFSLKCW